MPEKLDVRQFLNDPVEGKRVIRQGLEQDLKCAIFTLNEVLKSQVMFDAYVESVWTRYMSFYEKEQADKAQAELFPNAPDYIKPNGHGK